MSCQTIYVMINSFLPDEEKRIVAAHELGHIILHRKQLKLAPMKDDVLYTMTNSTEYEANLFAADLLVEDDDVAEMSKNEDLDYFGFCSNLNVSPDLMSFKLYSLMKRGHAYHMPMEIQSNFLAKESSNYASFRFKTGIKPFFLSVAGVSALIYDEGVMRAQHPAFL